MALKIINYFINAENCNEDLSKSWTLHLYYLTGRREVPVATYHIYLRKDVDKTLIKEQCTSSSDHEQIIKNSSASVIPFAALV